MDKKEFVEQYVAIFSATYTATHYDDACLNSKQESLEHITPVEDAIYLAEKAWDKYVEFRDNHAREPELGTCNLPFNRQVHKGKHAKRITCRAWKSDKTCAACGVGIDDDGDGNCGHCAQISRITPDNPMGRESGGQYGGYAICTACREIHIGLNPPTPDEKCRRCGKHTLKATTLEELKAND